MHTKNTPIPVNAMTDDFGMTIEQISADNLIALNAEELFEEPHKPHRHNCHAFFLVRRGTISIEIDFQIFIINPSSLIYVHPNKSIVSQYQETQKDRIW